MDQAEASGGTPRQGILLAAAMFVFVIDTSFMNVSISAVVNDLDTTVSGVQSAVAIEALVSAAFILISSKVGDLFGRKRAFVVGMMRFAPFWKNLEAVAHTLPADHAIMGDTLSGRPLGRQPWSKIAAPTSSGCPEKTFAPHFPHLASMAGREGGRRLVVPH